MPKKVGGMSPHASSSAPETAPNQQGNSIGDGLTHATVTNLPHASMPTAANPISVPAQAMSHALTTTNITDLSDQVLANIVKYLPPESIASFVYIGSRRIYNQLYHPVGTAPGAIDSQHWIRLPRSTHLKSIRVLTVDLSKIQGLKSSGRGLGGFISRILSYIGVQEEDPFQGFMYDKLDFVRRLKTLHFICDTPKHLAQIMRMHLWLTESLAAREAEFLKTNGTNSVGQQIPLTNTQKETCELVLSQIKIELLLPQSTEDRQHWDASAGEFTEFLMYGSDNPLFVNQLEWSVVGSAEQLIQYVLPRYTGNLPPNWPFPSRCVFLDAFLNFNVLFAKYKKFFERVKEFACRKFGGMSGAFLASIPLLPSQKFFLQTDGKPIAQLFMQLLAMQLLQEKRGADITSLDRLYLDDESFQYLNTICSIDSIPTGNRLSLNLSEMSTEQISEFIHRYIQGSDFGILEVNVAYLEQLKAFFQTVIRYIKFSQPFTLKIDMGNVELDDQVLLKLFSEIQDDILAEFDAHAPFVPGLWNGALQSSIKLDYIDIIASDEGRGRWVVGGHHLCLSLCGIEIFAKVPKPLAVELPVLFPRLKNFQVNEQTLPTKLERLKDAIRLRKLTTGIFDVPQLSYTEYQVPLDAYKFGNANPAIKHPRADILFNSMTQLSEFCQAYGQWSNYYFERKRGVEVHSARPKDQTFTFSLGFNYGISPNPGYLPDALEPIEFKNISSLETLILTHPADVIHMSHLPMRWSKMPSLARLIIAMPTLKVLPTSDQFSVLPNLKTLELRMNRLPDAALDGLANLEHLILVAHDLNNLSLLGEALTSLKSLMIISLDKNLNVVETYDHYPQILLPLDALSDDPTTIALLRTLQDRYPKLQTIRINDQLWQA